MERIIFFIALFLLLPVVIDEYFVFVWIMGSGVFTLAASLAVFGLCTAVHIWLIRKFRRNLMLKAGLMISALMASPVIAILVVAGVAQLFGIEIKVH